MEQFVRICTHGEEAESEYVDKDEIVRHVENGDKVSRTLNAKLPEAPVQPSALTVQLLYAEQGHSTLIDESGGGLYVVSAACTTRIDPLKRRRINLGVSITPPCGTHVTLPHISANNGQGWEITDHRLDKESLGEAVAGVVNYTDEPVIISRGTPVAILYVSRIRIKSESNPSEVDIS